MELLMVRIKLKSENNLTICQYKTIGIIIENNKVNKK
jgi:hypothetical protein